MNVLLFLIVFLTAYAQDSNLICIEVDDVELLANETLRAQKLDRDLAITDSLLNSQSSLLANTDSLVKMQDAHIRTLKKARLHYKKMFVREARKRNLYKDLLISTGVGILSGVLFKDELVGLGTASASFITIKLKLF